MVQILANAMATANQFHKKFVPGQVFYSIRLRRVYLLKSQLFFLEKSLYKIKKDAIHSHTKVWGFFA